MAHWDHCRAEWACFGRRGRPLGVVLLVLLVGCRVPAAHFVAPDPSASAQCCKVALTCQLLTDSALTLTCQPLRSGWEALYEAADHVGALGHGGVGKRVLIPLWGSPAPRASATSTPRAGLDLPDAGQLQDVGSLRPAGLQLYPAGTAALAALEQVLDQATSRIDVLMFEWASDALGAALAARLAAKAGPHVRVRVLVDGGGNLIFGRQDQVSAAAVNQVLCRLAQQPGVEVVRTRTPLGRFDHRKLVLVDGRIAWTGGRNFVQRAFAEQHDLSYTLTGPLVTELEERFDRFWREQGGTPKEHGAPTTRCQSPSPVNAWARLVHTEPANHQLQGTVYQAVDGARRYVYLENVYFTDSRLVYKLAQARRRGVDVRVVLTLASPSKPINRANRVTANRLLQAGVRVYLYPGMTHVKAAVVDGCWAYLGTGNFDALSFRHNREFGLVLLAGAVLGELEGHLFWPDFQPEWELREPLPVSVGDYACELLAALVL